MSQTEAQGNKVKYRSGELIDPCLIVCDLTAIREFVANIRLCRSTLIQWTRWAKRYARYIPVFGTVTPESYMALRVGIYSDVDIRPRRLRLWNRG
jgi:hypothetical protein